jgi:hypothetical protein
MLGMKYNWPFIFVSDYTKTYVPLCLYSYLYDNYLFFYIDNLSGILKHSNPYLKTFYADLLLDE